MMEKKKPKTIDGDKFIPCSEFNQTYNYQRTNKKSAYTGVIKAKNKPSKHNPKNMGT